MSGNTFTAGLNVYNITRIVFAEMSTVPESEYAKGQSRRSDGEGGRADGSAEGREDEEFGPGETAAELHHGQPQNEAGERCTTAGLHSYDTTLHHRHSGPGLLISV